MIFSWILDSGGVGRGAWQGGVIYEFMRWCRENNCLPTITMGASAGGYAAADVATGTEETVMKGWTQWGKPDALRYHYSGPAGIRRFRNHLHHSIRYVMQDRELEGVFGQDRAKKLLIFTTRVRRQDLRPFGRADRLRYFLKSATRKLPKALKYMPKKYSEQPVIFATNLPEELQSEYLRPLTRANFHAVIEASCLVPFAMGLPLRPEDLNSKLYDGDRSAVFLDGGYSVKMPMRLLQEDPRFKNLSPWIAADKTIIFCCDPKGLLWETSARLRHLNRFPTVSDALRSGRLLVISPDHKVEAGFLCTDNHTTMRTFNRGREQARRLLASENIRRFLKADLL